MKLSMKILILMGSLLLLAFALNVGMAPTALASDDVEFDMNDRFTFGGLGSTGASGDGEVEADDGSVEIEVEAEGLLPNHAYELKVTIGLPGGFADFGFVTFGPVMSDDDGEIEFEEDLDLLGLQGPGTYRLDLFVTHPHAAGPGAPGLGEDLVVLLGSEALLACQPAPMVTVGDDDDDDDDDD